MPETANSPSQPEAQARHPGIALTAIAVDRIDLRQWRQPEAPPQPEATFGFEVRAQKASELTGTCRLILQDYAPGVPLRLELEVTATFVAVPGGSVSLERFAAVQAPAFMFPFIREVVADLTGRTAFGPFYLPAVNMHALVGQKHVQLQTG